MPVRVKICGLTNFEDASAAVEAGADALGFVFSRKSPRAVSPQQAADIIRELPPFITTVGVFVNEKPGKIEEIIALTRLDVVQLHGSEPPEACSFSRPAIKAIRVKSLESLDPLIHYRVSVTAFLLDTFSPGLLGGTGQIFNWDIATYAKQFGPIILAGGLTPGNIAEAVKHVRPYGVDVSSGVESGKGKKDHQKIKSFIDQAKAA
ncbi:MAG: phosphoribosylanthranilate isomerase [Nitrospirota bacterium]